MKKRIIKILGFVLIMSLLLSVFTACGSKKDDQGESSVADEEASDDITEQPEDSGEQKIIVSLNNEPDGIDPNITSNSFAAPFLANCFEGLVTVPPMMRAPAGSRWGPLQGHTPRGDDR